MNTLDTRFEWSKNARRPHRIGALPCNWIGEGFGDHGHGFDCDCVFFSDRTANIDDVAGLDLQYRSIRKTDGRAAANLFLLGVKK